ncbi:MAG: hypothetical protein ACRD3Q_15275 [Terriglobales bacterium]
MRERQPLTPELEIMRHRGWRGGVITPHRAFVRLPLTARRILESATLAAVGSGAWVAALPAVGRLWARIFAFWSARLALRSEVTLVPQDWIRHVPFVLPCFGLPAGPASGTIWWITAGATVGLFAATFFFSEEALPWSYLIRGICLLQATALGYFAVASARFPHDLPSYTISMLLFSCILIGFVPLMYAFTFYLLNFSLWQKILLTVATIAHLVLFVPQQYMLQVYVLHVSVLFMPVLYFVFGPFLDIFAFIGFYAWGMSWRGTEPFET